MLHYAFSEQGIREGQEKLGADYPSKLESLVLVLSRIDGIYAISITLLISTNWVPTWLLQSAIYLVSQNLALIQIHNHEMVSKADLSILLITAWTTVITCIVFGLISYTMISTQASLFVKNMHRERQTE